MMQNSCGSRHILVYIFLVLFLWSPFKNSLISYIILFAFVVYVLMLTRGHLRIDSNWKIIAVLILLWFYGVIVGIINGNDIQYVFRNFAGLVFYVAYFFLVSLNINLSKIQHLLLLLGIFTGIITIVIYADQFVGLDILGNIPFFNNYVKTVTVEKVIYFPSREVIGVLFSFCLYGLLFGINNKIENIIGILISVVAIVFCGKSNGDMLALLLLALLILLARTIYNLTSKKIGIFVLIFVIIAFVILFVLASDKVTFFSLFNEQASGNSIRYQQISYLLNPNNFTFLGHGLGAVLWGIIRSTEYPYACEVIYLNLFHKIGIFALFIVFIYIWSIIKSIKILFKKEKNPSNAVPIGCLMYLVTSLGNPMLFSCVTVFMHICCLMFIAEDNKKKSNKINEMCFFEKNKKRNAL